MGSRIWTSLSILESKKINSSVGKFVQTSLSFPSPKLLILFFSLSWFLFLFIRLLYVHISRLMFLIKLQTHVVSNHLISQVGVQFSCKRKISLDSLGQKSIMYLSSPKAFNKAWKDMTSIPLKHKGKWMMLL